MFQSVRSEENLRPHPPAALPDADTEGHHLHIVHVPADVAAAAVGSKVET